MSERSEPRRAHLTGADIYRLVEEGARSVERFAEQINALNVFPVPDGDTGTNMLLTLRAALADDDRSGTVAEVAAGIARGAIRGGRGNSGVILSQFLKGFANGLEARDECFPGGLAGALREGAEASYQAVSEPVEGTMLTVLRAAGEAAAAGASVLDVLRLAHAAAESALARTPEQLPVLREAGVVDAGGQGVVAFLAGALAYVSGEEVPVGVTVPQDADVSGHVVSREFLEHSRGEDWGHCIQFVVEGEALDLDDMRLRMASLATSTVVVGDERLARVHVHAADAGPVFRLGESFGAVSEISVEDMDAQNETFAAQRDEPAPTGVVVVAPGDGFAHVFRDLGAAGIVSGGRTMNPSVEQLVEAARAVRAEQVILLPNDPNILLAAGQAAELLAGRLSVLQTRSVAQGVAAMLAFDESRDASENLDAMTSGMEGVRAGEVTQAVRSSSVDGIEIEAGAFIALLHGELVATGESATGAVLELLRVAGPAPGSLVTLYYGAGESADSAAEVGTKVQDTFDEVEVEVVFGGQAHASYLLSIE